MVKLLLIDNYDSFTYNLSDYLLRLGAQVQVVRNDQCSASTLSADYDFDAIVLSPGPETPEKAGEMMAIIANYHDKCPMLGVCLGHQAIGQFFGAPLVRAPKPMHGKTSDIVHDNGGIFAGLAQPLQVMRYHSLLLSSLEGTPLRAQAHTREGECMAFAHETLPLWGVQFHPESIGTPQGLALLGNWLGLLNVNRLAVSGNS